MEPLGKVEVFFHPQGFIEIIAKGVMDEKRVTQIFDGMGAIIQGQGLGRSAVFLLCDVREMTNVDTGGRRVVFNRLPGFEINRIGLFGKTLYIKYLVKFIAVGVGMAEKIRYFDQRPDAVSWLAGKGPA